MKRPPRLKYRRGLKIDPDAWIVLRDAYSLLDPSQRFDRSPRIPVSEEPFLIVRERFTHRQLSARAMQSPEGRKLFLLGWSVDGNLGTHSYPEAFQELLFGIHGSLQAREHYFRHRE